jgi:hypothetical protein
VDYCQQNGIVVQAYSPLIRAQKGMFDHPTITAISNKHGKDNAQVLIRWTLQKGYSVFCFQYIPVLLVDRDNLAGGSRYPKAQTQNELSRMLLSMTFSWTRGIWTIWTLLTGVTMDLFPGTLLMSLEMTSREAG